MVGHMADDVFRVGSALPAKLNPFGGAEPDGATIRASTPKLICDTQTTKNSIRNSNSKLNSRATTPKSTRSDRAAKGTAKNGLSRASSTGSSRSTPRPRSSKEPAAQPLSGGRSSRELPPSLVTRSASRNYVLRDQVDSDITLRDPPLATYLSSNSLQPEDSSPRVRSTPRSKSVRNDFRKRLSTLATKSSAGTGLPSDSPKIGSFLKDSLGAEVNSSESPGFMTRSTLDTRSRGCSVPAARSSREDRLGKSIYTPFKDLRGDLVESPHPPKSTAFRIGTGNLGFASSSNSTADISSQPAASDTYFAVDEASNRLSFAGANKQAQRSFGDPSERFRTTGSSISTPVVKLTDLRVPGSKSGVSPGAEVADMTPIANGEDYSAGDGSEVREQPCFRSIADERKSPVPNAVSGIRASGRIRKPTAKALESIALAKKVRKRRVGNIVTSQTTKDRKLGDTRSTRLCPRSENGKRLFGLAAAALAPNFVLPSDASIILQSLRKNFAAARGEGQESQMPDRTENSDGASEEEYFIIPAGHQLYRPANTYGDSLLPQPPMRVRSLEQAEKDRIFGYPPRMGERNLPRSPNAPFVIEDVDSVLAKIRAREAARSNEAIIGHSISWPNTEMASQQHGIVRHASLKLRINNNQTTESEGSPTTDPSAAQSVASAKIESPLRRRRRRATNTDERAGDKAELKSRRQTSVAPASPHSTRKRRRRTVGAVVKENVAELKGRRHRIEEPVEEEKTTARGPRLRLVFAKPKRQA